MLPKKVLMLLSCYKKFSFVPDKPVINVAQMCAEFKKNNDPISFWAIKVLSLA